MNTSSPVAARFSSYQKFVIAILAFLQFTVVLDFMVLSPLGAILLEKLQIGTSQFGLVVSAYAIAAGVSGFLSAGFADRYDRKRILLFFYGGFVLGTALCGIAPNFPILLFARIVTGLFGGVIGSVSMAIVADLFPIEMRGRVMGFVQTAFAGSQVLGLPIGVFLAARFGWHSPFMMITGLSALVGVVIMLRLKPINEHLRVPNTRNPVVHLWKTATSSRYQVGFTAGMLMALGGFMLMPFGSTFTVNNLGIPLEKLPVLYAFTGVFSFILGPLLGRLSDRWGKYRTFVAATVVGAGLVLYYTQLGPTPLSTLIILNIVLFGTISGRMISSAALTSAIPAPADRGAFMSISASLQQLSGGLGSYLAGWLVTQNASGQLEHYPRLGYVVAGAMLITVVLMYRVQQLVKTNPSPQSKPVVLETA